MPIVEKITSTNRVNLKQESSAWDEGVQYCENVFKNELTQLERDAVMKYYKLTGGSGLKVEHPSGNLIIGGKVILEPIKNYWYELQKLAPAGVMDKPESTNGLVSDPRKTRKQKPVEAVEVPAKQGKADNDVMTAILAQMRENNALVKDLTGKVSKMEADLYPVSVEVESDSELVAKTDGL